MKRILITGSNRGIGLALVNQYLIQEDAFVIATCRHPSVADDLRKVADDNSSRVHIVELNVADSFSIQQAVHTVTQWVDGLDMLINNAGILPGGVDDREPNISAFGHLDPDAMLNVFRVNSIAPVMVTQAFVELLRNGKGPRVINLSSNAGSINTRNRGCDYGYPSSKAALNMMSRCLSFDLQGDDIIVISMHPGFIKTDMGGVNAHLTLDEAIPSMIEAMDNLTMDGSGQFFDWEGKQVGW